MNNINNINSNNLCFNSNNYLDNHNINYNNLNHNFNNYTINLNINNNNRIRNNNLDNNNNRIRICNNNDFSIVDNHDKIRFFNCSKKFH